MGTVRAKLARHAAPALRFLRSKLVAWVTVPLAILVGGYAGRCLTGPEFSLGGCIVGGLIGALAERWLRAIACDRLVERCFGVRWLTVAAKLQSLPLPFIDAFADVSGRYLAATADGLGQLLSVHGAPKGTVPFGVQLAVLAAQLKEFRQRGTRVRLCFVWNDAVFPVERYWPRDDVKGYLQGVNAALSAVPDGGSEARREVAERNGYALRVVVAGAERIAQLTAAGLWGDVTTWHAQAEIELCTCEPKLLKELQARSPFTCLDWVFCEEIVADRSGQGRSFALAVVEAQGCDPAVHFYADDTEGIATIRNMSAQVRGKV